MSIVRLVLPLAESFLIGYLLISLLLTRFSNGPSARWLKAFCGFGLGLGITSITYFIWRLTLGPANSLYIFAELTATACLAILAYRARRKAPADPGDSSPASRRSDSISYLAFLLTPAVFGALLVFFLGMIQLPHGAWDAWAIWNKEARFLYRENQYWFNAFSALLPHPDYPLLLPASIARIWNYLGREMQIVPALIALVFSVCTGGLLVSAVSFLRGRPSGYLAGLALFCGGAFIVQGPMQYADIPLGFFMLAAVIAAYFYRAANPQNPGWLTIAGLFSGLAVWTKNEGWLFLTSLLLTQILVSLFGKRTRPKPAEIPAFLAGLMPVLLVVLYFKVALVPPNDLIAGQGTQTVDRIFDYARFRHIANAFFTQLIRLDVKNSTPAAWLLLVAFLFGVKPKADKVIGTAAVSAIWALTLASYFFVYLITPNDLQWQLSNSLPRLFLQLWPIFVFNFALLVSVPAMEPAILNLKVRPDSHTKNCGME